jgi:hypothetical protein
MLVIQDSQRFPRGHLLLLDGMLGYLRACLADVELTQVLQVNAF